MRNEIIDFSPEQSDLSGFLFIVVAVVVVVVFYFLN